MRSAMKLATSAWNTPRGSILVGQFDTALGAVQRSIPSPTALCPSPREEAMPSMSACECAPGSRHLKCLGNSTRLIPSDGSNWPTGVRILASLPSSNRIEASFNNGMRKFRTTTGRLERTLGAYRIPNGSPGHRSFIWWAFLGHKLGLRVSSL